MAEEAVVDDRTLDQELDASMRATLNEINSREDEPATDASADNHEPSKEDLGTQPAAEARARDEAGKFVKTEKPAAPEQASQPNAQEATAPAAAAPTDDLSGIDINRAPSSWKPAAKAAWANLPPEVRQEIYRREGDFHHGNSAIKENADFGQKIRNLAQPYDMLIKAEGATHEAAFDDYLKSAAALRIGSPQQKLDLIKRLDAQFNCGLNADFQRAVQAEVQRITGGEAPAPQPTYQDPRVDQLLQFQQQQEQQRAAAEERVTMDAANEFINAKDDKGQPLHMFVDNVMQDMIDRCPAIRRQNPALSHADVLNKAYEAAVWANPDTRAVLISQQQAQANQPEDNLRKVEQAKRATAVNVPKRGAIPASQPSTHLVFGTAESDESMRETFRTLTANN